MEMGNVGLSHKEAAIMFLRLASSGNVREAYEKYVDPSFRHHNPFFKGDAESLIKGMEENAAKFPDKVFKVLRALEQGEFVAVHSRVDLKPNEGGIALVHIFRFKGDRIVELWDVAQPAPKDSPNERGMF